MKFIFESDKFRQILMIICLILFVCPQVAFSNCWQNYTNSNEISGSDIIGNYLWLATTGGVVRWNLTDSTYIKYTTVKGLADHNVKDVFVDDIGNIWFGTVEGVQKYDGAVWTTYNTVNSPLPNNTVYAIAQDTMGIMWFGTAYGIAAFDGASTWQVYTDLGGGATNVDVRGIGIDSQNRIWTANNPDIYGDPGGVSVFNGSTWTRHDPNTSGIGQYFLSLTVGGNDYVWAGSWTSGVYVYNGSVWNNYNSSGPLMGNQIECFAVEEDSVIWIANHSNSADGGVSKFNGTTWVHYNTYNSGIQDKRIYSISIDGVNKYFGTGVEGTSKYNNSTWSSFKTSNEPHCNWITSIADNNNGTVYFGTEYYGIAVYDNGVWSLYYSGNSGLYDNNVNCVYIDAGDTLWVGTQWSGVFKHYGSTWIHYDTLNSGLLGNIILSIVKDSQGNLWLGTAGWDGPGGQDGALAKFTGSSWTNYYLSNSGIIDDDGLNVTVDKGDTIWIGSEEGISKYNQFTNSWTNYTTANGLIHNYVRAIAIDSLNNKWFATRGGVSEFDGSTWTNFNMSNGIANNEVRDIAIDSSNIWIATENGVSFFDGANWTTYRQTDSLADNYVKAVCVDVFNNKWFGTRRCGISIYNENTLGVSEIVTDIQVNVNLLMYPNPFTDEIQIHFQVEDNCSKQGFPIVRIFDISGRLVYSIKSISGNSGFVSWDGSDENNEFVNSGVYFIKIQISPENIIGSKRAILIR